MKSLKLTKYPLAILFALAVPVLPVLAQQPKAAPLQVTEPATNPGDKPGVAPVLTEAELASLAEVLKVSADVAKELQTARLYLEAAERKADSVQYFSHARRLRILAKRCLDPDLWDVALVTVGPEGQQHQEWRIVPIGPSTREEGKGGTP